MKRKIGNLRGKPIIEGDKNLMTPNELHVSELGGGNSGSERYLYFKWEDDYPHGNIESDFHDIILMFSGSILITNLYSSLFQKNINCVTPYLEYMSGQQDIKFSGIVFMNLVLKDPTANVSMTLEEYMQLVIQTDGFPKKEEIKFLLAHKVSEEEFFKGVEPLTSLK